MRQNLLLLGGLSTPGSSSILGCHFSRFAIDLDAASLAAFSITVTRRRSAWRACSSFI
jgi:hypothetical protein